MMRSFLKQLDERARAVDSLLCVGLDPHAELLPHHSAEAARDFCLRLIDATAAVACAFKPNSAFFEVFGGAGIEALQQVIAHVPEGIPVILDAKRGDIASTAQAYAQSVFDTLGATAVTLSPYLGYDSIQPFLAYPGKGAFVLCKTSNPGAHEFQNLMGNGQLLYETVAERCAAWNTADNLGLVVGATDLHALSRIRKLTPDAWFLVPGIGAQGGELDAALRAGLRADGLGMLINASRSIAKASDPRAEAIRLRDAINLVRHELSGISTGQTTNPTNGAISQLAMALYTARCVHFGHFTLKSGLTSPIYLDLRRLASYPNELKVVAAALNDLLNDLHFDHIAGIPYAALPIATAVAVLYGRSLIYPRREVKEYGTKSSVEGSFREGDTAVMLDDLATTGETKFEMIERLKGAGLIVQDIVVVVDREQGAAHTLSNAGYNFHALVTLKQLLPIWEQQGVLSTEQRREIDLYLAGSR